MIFSAPLYGKVLRSEKTQTRRLVQSGDLATKYRVGMRRAVQKGRGVHGEAHIILTDVRRETLGEFTFEDARAEGFKTTDDFKSYWIGLHDTAWAIRWEAGQQRTPEGQTIDEFNQAALERFAKRWAPKEVWVLTFKLDQAEQPRFLMQGSPLTEGGKARLMSNRRLKRKPGKAKTKGITGPEAIGYVESQARALAREPEPVDERTQDKFSREGHQGFMAREAQREIDRERLSAEERLGQVRIDARARGVDISHLEAAIVRQVRAAERKVHQKAA